jgi:hypothetical protein
MENATIIGLDHKVVRHEYIPSKGYVFSCWTGEWADEKTMFEVVTKQAEVVRDNRCPYLLVDSTGYRGSTPKFQKWVNEVWSQMAYDYGLRHFAVVVPKDVFGSITIKQAFGEKLSSLINAQIFPDLKEAENWLLAQQHKK